jgi:hypothetical protein
VNKNVTVPEGNSATPTPSTAGSGKSSKPGELDDCRLVREPQNNNLGAVEFRTWPALCGQASPVVGAA